MRENIKEEIKDLCVDGLMTDGEHHKQWFLEEILKKLGFDLVKISRDIIEEEGEDSDEYEWARGIPPWEE